MVGTRAAGCRVRVAGAMVMSFMWGSLVAEEVRMEVWCRWDSASGHGGPTLEPEQMRLMGELNLQCGFDIYFAGDEEEP